MTKIKLINPPVCAYSKCENTVVKSNGQWKKYCSKECGLLGGKETRKKTFLAKYGVENPLQFSLFKEKSKKTFFEKYGVDNPQKSTIIREKTKNTNLRKYGNCYTTIVPEFREKQKNTLLNKYGVSSPLKSKILLEKMRETNLKKYGVEWTSLDPLVRKKQETTCLTRYGSISPLGSEKIRNKCIDTLIKNYGVDNPTKNVDIFEKALLSGKRAKDYVLPSGKKIKLRGYEPNALDILLKTYGEEKIKYKIKEMPIIKYVVKNKTRRYYPDFYIPLEKLIIEVKSTYTYNSNKTVNFLKKDACITLGYTYMFMIISNNECRYEIYSPE